MRRLTTSLAWVLATTVTVNAIAYVVLYLLILSYPFQPYGFPGAVIIFCVTGAVIGALIAQRQPRNGVGWVLIGAGLCLAIVSTAQVYAIRTFFVAPGSLPLGWLAAWLGSWMWAPGVALITNFVPLLFPDGDLRGRPAKALLAFSSAGTIFLSIGAAVFTFPGTGPVQIGPDAQLTGVHSLSNYPAFGPVYLVLPVGGVLAMIRLGLRLRRSTGEQRQQFKWFAYALGIVLVGVVVSGVGNVFASQGANQQGRFYEATAAVFVASFLAIPIGAGISILRYRLYDIDIVINRTIVYGLLAVLITAVYVGIVAGVGSVVHAAGGGNLALSIGATALVAVAFQPLRGTLQRLANRLVYGKQATPYEVLSAFSEGVAETYAEEEVLTRMARLLADATAAERAEVWIAVGPALRRAVAWPPSASEADPAPVALAGNALPALSAGAAIPVRHQGELLGALTVSKRGGDAMKPVEAQLLDDLARQAGLVLRTAALTESLKTRLVDLRDSRQRLVAAQDAERRRLERNLHDGAQQNLVALKVKLGLAKALATKDPQKASELLDQLTTETDDAIETLRDLARGIYPPLLADKGLAAALEAQARKATLPVHVDADGVGRYSEEIEAAVYFCSLEALQNIQKYASADRATVRLRQSDGALSFEVRDDGRGFDPATTPHGSGLQNMADRMDALGGTLTVESTPGEGTLIAGTIGGEPVSSAAEG